MKSFLEFMQDQQSIVPFRRLGISPVYHRGGAESLGAVDPFRPSTKQRKRGSDYAGFYVGPLDHVEQYPGENTLKLDIDPDARVLLVPAAGATDRLDVKYLRSQLENGVDMIWGKDIRGLDQGIVVNKAVIKRAERV